MKKIIPLDSPPIHGMNWKGVSLLVIDHLGLYLIRRSEKMPTHPKQIAGFGGYRKEDEVYPWEVAKREFTEETTLSSQFLSPLGHLNTIKAGRGTLIVPIVAQLTISQKDFFASAKSNGEWTDLFYIPHQYFLNHDRWQWGLRSGVSKDPVLFIALSKNEMIFQNDEKKESFTLWGATAKMVWELKMLIMDGEII
jgi:coenzyme A diphosphatase NUDT7